MKSDPRNQNNENIKEANKQQSNIDINSLIDMCTKKLEKEHNHKKALLLRASSYIKKGDLDKVKK